MRGEANLLESLGGRGQGRREEKKLSGNRRGRGGHSPDLIAEERLGCVWGAGDLEGRREERRRCGVEEEEERGEEKEEERREEEGAGV